MQAPLPSAFTSSSNAFSVSWWSKALAAQSLNCCVSVQYGSADTGKLVNVYYYTTFGGIIFTRDSNANSTAPTTAITQQAWHHFSYTYSGSGTYGTIYVDGVAVPTSTSASTSAVAYGLSLGIGQGGSYKANMAACDLMLHNYPLPASFIAQIANPSNVLLEVADVPLLLPAWHRSYGSRTGGIPLPLFQGAV